MALPFEAKKAFAQGGKGGGKKGGKPFPPTKKPKGKRPEEEDEDLDDEEPLTDEPDDIDDEGDDDVVDEGDDDEPEPDDDPKEEGSEDAFDISKLTADVEQLEKIVEDIEGDLDGEDVDPDVVAKVKGSLGRLPKGSRKLIRELKDKDFDEVEELVSQVAADGSVADEGRFAAWLYQAAQVA